MTRLSRDFYTGDTVQIARDLLGKYLVRRWKQELLVCQITETEAYVGRCDKACHAYGYRKTDRNAVMFGPPGHAYIYLIYGMHHCLNFVTEPEGEPSAVLLRGVRPISGMDTISKLRFGKPVHTLSAYQRKNFMNGPGKVCKGLSLSRNENGMDLTGNTLFICTELRDVGLADNEAATALKIHQSTRIGIDYAEEATAFPWRFYLE